MSDFSPIAWTEGMFLRPQHMQQQERYLQFQQSRINAKVSPLSWGIFDLDIDNSMLSLGQFRLNSVECLFQDNTLAVLPEQGLLPEAISIPSGTLDQLIYLVLPISKSTGLNISDEDSTFITRYHFHDHNIIDTSIGSEATEVLQIGKLHCQFKLQSEDRSGYVSIAIAKIIEVSEEGVISLDKKFIPPCLSIDNIQGLIKVTREIKGMINQRAEAIAARLCQSQGSSSSISDFLMLQLLNKYQPLFDHYSIMSGIHPETLYRTIISFSGELATFSSATKRTPEFPKYQHDNLYYVFSNVMASITQSLSSVLEQTAIQLALEKSQYGIYFSPIHDKNSLEHADFIIAIKASLPNEEIRKRLPAQIKIGSVESIRELVNNQLPGIGIIALPVAPRQVPYHSGYHYFQLDKQNSHWLKLQTSGGIALHLSGHYPDLEIEVWVVNH
ncbi:type VI secretion system baseplate subunit TssK [Colwellia sp. E2M01]|uniref:type VI secretion system baseplate subunit TssK n=1 Tax=Colwellia sp. E2M01 TaxID=2841561 RepID=UPI001C08E2A7|nr:type VI secretion system baseplate subunit TssK [Colwellia sp. E2M01]MBU2870469.1 type VI secretion system baseplate subunit TssK [Colwellia sp. E2M01]